MTDTSNLTLPVAARLSLRLDARMKSAMVKCGFLFIA